MTELRTIGPITLRATAECYFFSWRWALINGEELRVVQRVRTPEVPSMDAWSLRERFLQVREPTEVAQFLSDTGLFCSLSIPSSPVPASVSEFRLFQEVIRTRLLGRRIQLDSVEKKRIARILSRDKMPHVQLEWKDRTCFARFRPHNVLQAILVSIELDRWQGAAFALCARQGCGNIYPVTSKHERLYCDLLCAQGEASRRYRERKRQKVE